MDMAERYGLASAGGDVCSRSYDENVCVGAYMCWGLQHAKEIKEEYG